MSETIEPVRVEGLREFLRNLRTIDRQLPKAARQAGNTAAQLVVDDAKPRVPIGPGHRGHAKDSIRVASTQSAVRVRAGGKKIPYYGWLDFGGRVGINRSVSRPFIKQGRYLWASFADNRAGVQAALVKSLADVAAEAGMEPH